MSACNIIIPVWNQLEATRDCINSIKRCTEYPYQLIIIDNASDYETATYLEDLKKSPDTNVMLVRNEKNEGFIKAVNKAVLLSTAEYLCILNNDTIVSGGWLGEMVNVLNKGPLIGIVNPSSNTLGQKLTDGVTPDDFAKNSRAQRGLFVQLGNAFGFCMLMRRKLCDEIGLFDEIYGMGNFEDTDFSLRTKEKGYKTVRAFASYVYHKESRSFNKLSGFKKDFERNRQIFESKWGRTKRTTVVFKNINKNSLSQLRNILNEYAKEKSWVYVISPLFDTKNFFESFSNLSFYHFRYLFYISAFLKIIFKKKKANIVYCDNKFFSNFLKVFKIFHNADIRTLEEAT